MPILALGISHRRAPVDLLERLAFADQDFVKAYRRGLDHGAIHEIAILSTCNRVEAYGSVSSYHAGFQALKTTLCESRDVSPDEIAEPLYSHYEEQAAEHLFTVAAGLDSMVLGEPQILSQVRDAHGRAEAEGASGPQLTALFHGAARAGRRVRRETAIGAAPDAFIEAGAGLAAETLGGLTDRRVLVVGAGQMSSLAVRHLRARGVGRVRVINRSVERARALAERTGAEHGALDALPQALARADLVVSATGSAGIVIHEQAMSDAIAGRTTPLFVLDLAVPRDVEPLCGFLPGVRLIDIDGLRSRLAGRGAGAPAEIERAHEIVGDELRRYALRRRSEWLGPLIAALRERGDRVRASELERHRSRLGELTPDQLDALDALTKGIVAKLLHQPIVRLKELSSPGSDDAHVAMLAELFGLDLPSE